MKSEPCTLILRYRAGKSTKAHKNIKPLVPKLSLGTQLECKLCLQKQCNHYVGGKKKMVLMK